MIRRRPGPQELALGIFEPGSQLLATAERLRLAGLGPIVGGIAVFLHGYRRTTEVVDLYCDVLETLGARWDAERREHTLDGVPVHLVTKAQTGSAPRESVEIQSVPVISLPDLIAFKLRAGLSSVARANNLADVVELIRAAPLNKTFTARLPKELRSEFRKLIDAVQADQR